MSRYKHTKIVKQDMGRYYKTTILPGDIPKSIDDIYIQSSAGHRLDILAKTYYGDVKLWWIIALANNLGKGTMMIPNGIQLRIPADTSEYFDALKSNNKGL